MTKDKHYVNHLGYRHQLIRAVWTFVWMIFARWMPRSVGSGWKRMLLRMFGAKMASTAVVYSSAKVYYPKNLIMREYSCLASDVECYNVDMIEIDSYATVSQGAFLCTAGHDINSPEHTLITAPIVIRDHAWIGARAYVGMGVVIGTGAVVGATASVYKSVDAWTVVGGNPANFIKARVLINTKRGGVI